MEFKKKLSACLAAAMMLSSVPIGTGSALGIGVWAEGEQTLQQQINSATSEITLEKDYDEAITIGNGKTITLNLGDHKLSNTDKAAHTITVESGGKLTITSGTNGTVDSVVNGKAALLNEAGGTVIIEGGTFTRSLGSSDNDPNNNGEILIIP